MMSSENEFFDDVQKTAPSSTVQDPTPVAEVEEASTETAPKKKTKRILDPENYIQLDWIVRHGRFMLFLFFIIILYIFNSHYSVKTQFSIKKLDEEIKELNSEYIILKSEIMNLSKQSEVAKMVEADSLKIITTPPTPLAPFQSEQP